MGWLQRTPDLVQSQEVACVQSRPVILLRPCARDSLSRRSFESLWCVQRDLGRPGETRGDLGLPLIFAKRPRRYEWCGANARDCVAFECSVSRLARFSLPRRCGSKNRCGDQAGPSSRLLQTQRIPAGAACLPADQVNPSGGRLPAANPANPSGGRLPASRPSESPFPLKSARDRIQALRARPPPPPLL